MIGEIGSCVVETVGEKCSTWRRWNLIAEASRQTMGWRFATMQDRETIVAMVADTAQHAPHRLTPPDLAASLLVFRRPDVSTMFRPKGSTVFSSRVLLAAEDRLLQRANDLTGPTVTLATVEKATGRPDPDRRILGDDQADALTRIAASGRMLDVLVGPAGVGKTPAMNALRRAWEAEHGPGSVVGLAPLCGRRPSLGRRPRDRHREHREMVAQPPPTAPPSNRGNSSSSTKPPSPVPSRWTASPTSPRLLGRRCC